MTQVNIRLPLKIAAVATGLPNKLPDVLHLSTQPTPLLTRPPTLVTLPSEEIPPIDLRVRLKKALNLLVSVVTPTLAGPNPNEENILFRPPANAKRRNLLLTPAPTAPVTPHISSKPPVAGRERVGIDTKSLPHMPVGTTDGKRNSTLRRAIVAGSWYNAIASSTRPTPFRRGPRLETNSNRPRPEAAAPEMLTHDSSQRRE